MNEHKNSPANANGMSISSSVLRVEAVKFLIKCSQQLKLSPIVKYSALSLFTPRFLSSTRNRNRNRNRNDTHWLLTKPLKFPQLQLFSLISLWISSKTYDSPPLSLNSLKPIADQHINDQHFTKSDFLDAEILFLQSLNFEIGTLKNSTFLVMQELMMKLKEVAKVGEMVSFDACCDVMDLMYESDQISQMYVDSPVYLAAGVVVAVYAMTVPLQKSEFPMVGWVNFVTDSACREDDLILLVKLILQHILT